VLPEAGCRWLGAHVGVRLLSARPSLPWDLDARPAVSTHPSRGLTHRACPGFPALYPREPGGRQVAPPMLPIAVGRASRASIVLADGSPGTRRRRPPRALVDEPIVALPQIGIRDENRPSRAVDRVVHLASERLPDVLQAALRLRDLRPSERARVPLGAPLDRQPWRRLAAGAARRMRRSAGHPRRPRSNT